MVRGYLVFLVVLAVVLPATICERREKRGLFGDVDAHQIPGMMNNKAFVNSQHRCITAPESIAAVLCDRMGKKFRAILNETLRNADCGNNCSSDDKEIIVELIDIVQNRYQQMWKDIIHYYDVSDEAVKKLNEWKTKESSPKTPTN